MECIGIVKSGPKKGEVCGRTVGTGSRALCGYHRKKVQKYKKMKRRRPSKSRRRKSYSRVLKPIPEVIMIEDYTIKVPQPLVETDEIIPCVI